MSSWNAPVSSGGGKGGGNGGGGSPQKSQSGSLQAFAERFMAAGVGNSRAGFDFDKPNEGFGESGGGGAPGVAIPQPGDGDGHQQSSPPRSPNSSSLSRSPTQDAWKGTFHPGGMPARTKSQYDSSKMYEEGRASGQSISEIYAQKRNSYYVPRRKDDD